MKNAVNIAAAQRTPTVFETLMLRSLKRRSGTSGDRTSDSMATKSARSSAAPPSNPSVSADVQPFWLPLTIA